MRSAYGVSAATDTTRTVLPKKHRSRTPAVPAARIQSGNVSFRALFLLTFCVSSFFFPHVVTAVPRKISECTRSLVLAHHST